MATVTGAPARTPLADELEELEELDRAHALERAGALEAIDPLEELHPVEELGPRVGVRELETLAGPEGNGRPLAHAGPGHPGSGAIATRSASPARQGKFWAALVAIVVLVGAGLVESYAVGRGSGPSTASIAARVSRAVATQRAADAATARSQEAAALRLQHHQMSERFHAKLPALEALAFGRGRVQGLKDGFGLGKSAGLSQGKSAGMQKGLIQGRQQGRRLGRRAGLRQGRQGLARSQRNAFRRGYHQGVKAGSPTGR